MLPGSGVSPDLSCLPPRLGGRELKGGPSATTSLPLTNDQEPAGGLAVRCYNGGEDVEKPIRASPESAR